MNSSTASLDQLAPDGIVVRPVGPGVGGTSLLQLLQKPRRRTSGRDRFADEARFLRTWVENPLLTGAVAPSGRHLADTMASYIDPRASGRVLELGPGTGPVTDALVRHGVEQERLVLVEFNPEFAALLARRYPRATVICGDAYDLRTTLADLTGDDGERFAGVVSSLPLFTKPPKERLDLLQAAHDLCREGAPFIQFTYHMVPPLPARSPHYTSTASERVWRNMPPARVWVYRRG